MELLTQMGKGEAFVTLLNERRIPIPLEHNLLCPQRSRMDILTTEEIEALVSKSKLPAKYSKEVDGESAYEILTAKLTEAVAGNQQLVEEKTVTNKKAVKEESIFDNPIVKQVGRTAVVIITRNLLGTLGLGGSSRKR